MESQRGFIVQWHITDTCNLQCHRLCNRRAACVTYGCSNHYSQPDPQCWYTLEVL